MARLAKILLKLTLIVSAMVLLAGGAVLLLTDPTPKTLPSRIWQRVASSWANRSSRSASDDPRSAPDKPLPLFSDGWLDDSGYLFAFQFAGTPNDPTSLADLRASTEGQGRRGVETLTARLKALDFRDPAHLFHATQLNLLIGILLMYEGEFAEADAHLARAQTTASTSPETFRANLEALRGIAAFRLGEVQNCVACRTEASCIYPLAASAVHQRTSGSKAAIDHFTRYLRERPEDLGVRWLLNVAHMTLGTYPEGVPKDLLLPLGRFAPGEANAPARMVNVAPLVGLDARGEAMSGGCVVDDFDGDGRLDLFTTSTDWTRGAALWHNRGDGTFEDRSSAAGLDDQIMSLNACHADIDNDGDLDIFLMRGAWESPKRPSLLRNRGGGVFDDVTYAAGVGTPMLTQAAGWSDFDGDGFVDLYVGGEYVEGRPDSRNRGHLYRNKGDGTFEDVADRAGVANERYAKGVAWGDYDNDGRPDLFVSNMGQPSRLYHNNGDGTFADRAKELGVAGPMSGFACWFWDYDNDGRLDLWVNGYEATLSEVVADQIGKPAGGERPRLYRNLGAEGFENVTAKLGLDRVVLPMGSNFGDFDNDGFLDIYLGTGKPRYSYLTPNVLFRNVAARHFEDVTAATGTGHLQKGHGIAFADWDRDGDLDIFLESGGATPGDRAHNVLFQNPGHGHHWLTVKLIGTRTNRAALGARVRVVPAGPGEKPSAVHRMISRGSSFGGNPFACTIGLGEARAIEELEVSWPTSGTHQVFHDVPIDRSIEITEGREGFRILDAPPIPLP